MANWKSIALWAFPVFFLNFWTFSRIHAYFFQTAEWNHEDFAGTVLADDIPAEVKVGFFAVMDRFFDKADPKYWTIRTHIALSAPMGIITMLQLFPFLRKRNINLHRKLGYAYVALLVPFTIEQIYTDFYVGMSPLGPVVKFGNISSLVVMVVSTALGIYFAKQHKVQAHRVCMLINAAGLYINPTQRFLWALMGKANFQAPYSSYEDWKAKPVTASEAAALCLCYGTSAVYILSAAMSKKSLKAKAA